MLFAVTDLYLFLSQRNTADDLVSRSFVRFGVPLVLGFEDCMIFRAAEKISKQTFDYYLYQVVNTSYGGVSAAHCACFLYQAACSCSQSPESEQGMHSCPQDYVSCLLSFLARSMILGQAYSP